MLAAIISYTMLSLHLLPAERGDYNQAYLSELNRAAAQIDLMFLAANVRLL